MDMTASLEREIRLLREVLSQLKLEEHLTLSGEGAKANQLIFERGALLAEIEALRETRKMHLRDVSLHHLEEQIEALKRKVQEHLQHNSHHPHPKAMVKRKTRLLVLEKREREE